jgi:ZIP family zinc transporter
MIWTTTWLGLLFVAVSVASAAALHILPGPVISLLLAFGSAALLFVVLEELIVQAYKARHAPMLAASLFAGFLLILVLGMLAGTSGG